MCKALGSNLTSNKGNGQHVRMVAAMPHSQNHSQHYFSLKSQQVPLAHRLPALDFLSGPHSLTLSLMTALSGSRLLTPPRPETPPLTYTLMLKAAPDPAHKLSPVVAAHWPVSFRSHSTARAQHLHEEQASRPTCGDLGADSNYSARLLTLGHRGPPWPLPLSS